MRRSDAFTLTEMLIVMGIIVVVAILAVPAFRAMTGSKSTESAANQISAALSRARLDAVGLQEPRGILFFRDKDTQRVGMVEVKGDAAGGSGLTLDLMPDRDTILLPAGVGIQFIDNAANATDDRYIGFNKATRAAGANAAQPDADIAYGGVVMFDRRGQLMGATTWDIHKWIPADPLIAGDQPKYAEIYRLMFGIADKKWPGASGPMTQPITPAPQTKIGFVLFDEEAFAGLSRTTAPNGDVDPRVTGTTIAGTYSPDEQAEEKWLDENAEPYLINRYNGTLIRSQ